MIYTSVCVSLCMHVYVYRQVCAYVGTCVYMYVCMRACMYVYALLPVYVCARTRACICARVSVWCICLCSCACGKRIKKPDKQKNSISVSQVKSSSQTFLVQGTLGSICQNWEVEDGRQKQRVGRRVLFYYILLQFFSFTG